MRRTASEVIRELENRVARLEKQAGRSAQYPCEHIVKIIEEGVGYKLLKWELAQQLQARDLVMFTKQMGEKLGKALAVKLYTMGEIVIKGVDIVPVKKAGAPFYAVMLCSKTGQFIGLDRHFQRAFKDGFSDNDYLIDEFNNLLEYNSSADVGEQVSVPDIYSLSKKIDFSINMNKEITITLKR